MESIGFLFVFFLKGRLPWQGLREGNIEERTKAIIDCKKAITMQELTSDLPEEFYKFSNDARNLKFDEKPNYDKIIKKFY